MLIKLTALFALIIKILFIWQVVVVVAVLKKQQVVVKLKKNSQKIL
jgi:hypothetical protein